MSIQELIQKNKDLEKLNVVVSNLYLSQRQKIIDWHTQSLKDLIDAVIEDEKKDTSNDSVWGQGYNQAKHDTINRLKAIREML